MSASTMRESWDELVAAAMLGTDRREPPIPAPLIADVVADCLRPTPSARMLAQVAATVAVRRAGVLPGPPRPAVMPPSADDRPICPAAATQRWHHLVASWPVLEDEWMLAVIAHGWRLAPELVPDVLARHRRDPVRRARAVSACGSLAAWLVEHAPEPAAVSSRSPQPDPSPAEIGELPRLAIPSELQPLLDAPGAQVAAALAGPIGSASFGHAHRAVLVNVVARMRVDALDDVARALESIDPASVGYPLSSSLADLARTRIRMLAELTPVTPTL